MCSSAPFTASDQRYQWLSCHALTSAIPGLSQLVLAPYRNLFPYKPRRWPNVSATMQRLAFRRAAVPVSLRYNIPLYHLQVPVQHLRIVTETAQEQRTRVSLHEPCLCATFLVHLCTIHTDPSPVQHPRCTTCRYQCST